jgi:large subunit ribosomal protein L11
MPIPTIITVYADRSFSFITKSPPASYFIKKAAKINKGSQTPGKSAGIVGKVTMDQLREIASQKMADMSANDVDAGAKALAGSARSMGVEVVD